MGRVNLILVMVIFFSVPVLVSADFEVSSVREGVFIIGEPSPFVIYIQNTGSGEDSYAITPDVSYENPPGNPLPHLIKVHLQSNRIENLGAGEVRETQGTIIVLAPIDDPKATITFDVESDNGFSHSTDIEITGSFPVALPEFSLFGFLQLLLLAGLVISYSFHVR